jgi:hypothetical protein
MNSNTNVIDLHLGEFLQPVYQPPPLLFTLELIDNP